PARSRRGRHPGRRPRRGPAHRDQPQHPGQRSGPATADPRSPAHRSDPVGLGDAMSSPLNPVWIPRKRRGAELGLLVLALVIGIGSYAAVGLGFNGQVPSGIYTVGGIYALVALGAHVAVRRFAAYADPVLLPLVVALNGIEIGRASGRER